jgi:hypothetical protein
MPSPPLLLYPALALRKYHQHQVIGLEHVPLKGGALIVANHSFATYDLFLLGAAIYTERHRLVHALGHEWLFRVPGLRELMEDAGAVPAGPAVSKAFLRKGELVGIAPGGMREALRSSRDRYQIRWNDRRGFVRLAIESQCPVVLAACPRADEIFDVSTGVITDLVYERLRLPLAFVRGWGPVPRAIKLTHFVDKPWHPPAKPKGKAKLEALVSECHAELIDRMNALMERR